MYGRYWHIPVLSNRKYPRTPCEIPAEIIVSAKQPPIRCTIIDISEGGAGVSLGDGTTSGIPPSFELVIEGDPMRRACRATWRQPHALGVEFLK
jgi:PilZ domain